MHFAIFIQSIPIVIAIVMGFSQCFCDDYILCDRFAHLIQFVVYIGVQLLKIYHFYIVRIVLLHQLHKNLHLLIREFYLRRLNWNSALSISVRPTICIVRYANKYIIYFLSAFRIGANPLAVCNRVCHYYRGVVRVVFRVHCNQNSISCPPTQSVVHPKKGLRRSLSP